MVYNTNQLDFVNQDLTPKPQVHETLFSSPCPLFMFDTTSLDGAQENNVRSEYFQDALGLNTETWNNVNQHQHQHQVHVQIQVQGQGHGLAPHHHTAFTTGIDTNNYLPPLIENMESMVPLEVVQSCSMDEEGEIGLECLQRQELNDWVESQQQCSNFLFWDNVDDHQGPLGGDEIAPASSNVGTNTLTAFPSSLWDNNNDCETLYPTLHISLSLSLSLFRKSFQMIQAFETSLFVFFFFLFLFIGEIVMNCE